MRSSLHLMMSTREKHSGTLLTDRRVLIEGGKQVDAYDLSMQMFTQTVTSLPIGRVTQRCASPMQR